MKNTMKFLNNVISKLANSTTLLGVIEEGIAVKAKTKYDEWSPFKKFPDVKQTKITLSPLDEVFGAFGIKKRLSPAKIHYERHANAFLNRYALHNIKRLRRIKSHRVYWHVVNCLLQNSKVFFMLGLYHVFPKWHRTLPFWYVLSIYRKYKVIAKDFNNQMVFQRTYVDKTETTWRPLGVPSPEWRIYLHLLNQFLVLRTDELFLTEQHGFRPGKGTLTAWKAIMERINKYKYIYEFDYKNCFGELNLTFVGAVLDKAFGWPKYKTDSGYKLLNRVLLSNKQQPTLMCHAINKTDALTKEEASQIKFTDFILTPTRVGLAQGSPISPYTAALTIEAATLGEGENFEVIPSENRESWVKVESVRYADDGLIFSNELLNLEHDNLLLKRNGIEYNFNKTNLVKSGENWLKELKFLGLIYNGEILRAQTRNGSTLIFDKHSLMDALEKRNSNWSPGRETTEKHDSWIRFTRSDYWGFIMSRMYIGDWNLENYFQSFVLKYRKGSWCHSYNEWVGDYRRSQKNELLKKLVGIELTVFNSTSLCLISALEALRYADKKGYKPKVRRVGKVLSKCNTQMMVRSMGKSLSTGLGTT